MTGYCIPCYTFDKTNCGLIDAHEFAGDPDALAVLNQATDAVLPWLPPKALNREEMMARPHKNISFTWDESYTLPENFYLAYQRGAGARFHQLATRFLEDDTYFNPLAENENVLPGQHAYSHVNALCLGDAGLPDGWQRKASSRGAERLSVCARPEFCDRRLGAERDLSKAGDGWAGEVADEHA